MVRGQTAEIGDTRIADNGYHYTKVDPEEHPEAPNGWILTHWLTVEKTLGRHVNPEIEQVRFVDKKAKRDPYGAAGIQIIQKKKSSIRHRKAVVERKIDELQAELVELNKALGSEEQYVEASFQ